MQRQISVHVLVTRMPAICAEKQEIVLARF
jgi:hypothetical protein